VKENWIEVADAEAEQLVRRIKDNLTRRGAEQLAAGEDPLAIAQAVRQAWFGERADVPTAKDLASLVAADCDIVPRDYAITWRTPVLGPLHALFRRIIHAEMRRYLLRSLERQSYLNSVFLGALCELAHENQWLRQEIQRLNRRTE